MTNIVKILLFIFLNIIIIHIFAEIINSYNSHWDLIIFRFMEIRTDSGHIWNDKEDINGILKIWVTYLKNQEYTYIEILDYIKNNILEDKTNNVNLEKIIEAVFYDNK